MVGTGTTMFVFVVSLVTVTVASLVVDETTVVGTTTFEVVTIVASPVFVTTVGVGISHEPVHVWPSGQQQRSTQ